MVTVLLRIAVAIVVLGGLATCKLETGQFDDRGCNVDTDCRPDQTCTGQKLCAQLECTAPGDCGPGFQYDCQAGLCVATACNGVEGECALGYLCNMDTGFCAMECAGSDMDLDGVCDTTDNCILIANRNQADGDSDQKGDACDLCPADGNNDADSDTVCGDVDNCPSNTNTNQADRDSDGQGDECDTDDDGDGVLDVGDIAPLDPSQCQDTDSDSCDDCAVVHNPPSAANDGNDFDVDGDCDAGDNDDDNDGVADAQDLCPLGDKNYVSNSLTDVDGDGCRDDIEDADDDNDGVADVTDADPINNRVCGDSDSDSCDDCAVGVDGFGPLADKRADGDGLDSDGDGQCNAGDPDDDNDSVLDAVDTNPTNKFQCADVDGDLCDDCAVTGGPPNKLNDGTDTNLDGDR
jgi:large repetitive protein